LVNFVWSFGIFSPFWCVVPRKKSAIFYRVSFPSVSKTSKRFNLYPLVGCSQ
jgi:hypothetical protein